VEQVLPRGFRFSKLAEARCSETIHEVAFFELADGKNTITFALCPGGSLRLGWTRRMLALPEKRRNEWQKAQGRNKTQLGPEAWLDRYLTPARTVNLAPFLVEVRAEKTGADYLKDYDPKGPLCSHGHIVARLARDGLRLLSNDEWEHGVGAGSRTLFRWGDEWPDAKTGRREDPSAFGLIIDGQGQEASADPDCYRGDGGALLKDARSFEAHGVSATAFVWDLPRLGLADAFPTILQGARIRRARSVFPYSKR
jgi:hypothetical protein